MDGNAWSDADALAYIASYADLRVAFGADPAAGRRHYTEVGAAEGRTIVFEPFSYLASYSDLRSAFGADPAAAARHYIIAGASEGRAIQFDALGYIASYADLRAAFGADAAAGARHFVTAGAAEHRSVSFDAYGYLASHADLRAAFGTDLSAAKRHFINWGAGEARTINFDALGYIASYADLRAAFGLDTAAATRHFVMTGAAENRSIGFDALAYIASHADLRAAYGTNAEAAARHYIRFGAAEGRTISFDPVAYLLSHADVRAAKGMDAVAAARHYIEVGAAEGRSANGSFGFEQASHALPIGRTIAGAIETSGDRDWFAIDLTAGQGITFSFFASSGDGALSIFNTAGALQTALQTGARTSFMPSASGRYYVTVSTANSATGQYALLAEQRYTIVGTAADDTLTGSGGDDRIQGLDGRDTLAGRAGSDILEGGGGYDTLNGGAGHDTLYGNSATNNGNDGGDNLVDDLGGDDRLFGQNGDDFLQVSRVDYQNAMAASVVLLDGGQGDDNIRFSANRLSDTVTIVGGAGNDMIAIGSALKATVDAGEGNDKVAIGMAGGDRTISLGSGADMLALELNGGGAIVIGSPLRITDFAIGTDTINLDEFLSGVLIGWDPSVNPFATGHLRLVQSGADSLLLIDRDASGNSHGMATLMTLSNTSAGAFTVRDLGYAPDGSAAAARDIVGTTGNDTLTGSAGNDRIQGLAGQDILNGRGGNDVLEGGAGYDQLDGGLGHDTLYGNNATNSGMDGADYLFDNQGGDDRLYGQDGDDVLYVGRYEHAGPIAATRLILDGGAGNDTLNFASNRSVDDVTALGGAGNDRITIGSILRSVIHAGDGDDRVTLMMSGGDQRISLGPGADILSLQGSTATFSIGNPILITDFSASSDTIDLDQYLASTLVGWDRTANPFGTGHLQLVQSGNDTLVQLDRDGAAGGDYALATLMTLGFTTATAFDWRNFGYAPDGTATTGRTLVGTVGDDQLRGSGGDDLIRGLSGRDTLFGRAGNDVLEGGEGQDALDGGLGNDTLYGNSADNNGPDDADSLTDNMGGDDSLFGQDGNDYLYVGRFDYDGPNAASTVLLDGGSGNDDLSFYSFRFIDDVTLRGGTGDDNMNVGSVQRASIDAGDGNDKVTVGTSGGEQAITLGAGTDMLTLQGVGSAIAIGNLLRVTDFAIGIDAIALDQYLGAVLLGWDPATNPFATGHLRLMQAGGDTLLQIDRDGAAGSSHGFATLMTLAGTTTSSFTARDLGYAPVVAASTGIDGLLGMSADIGWAADPVLM